MNFKKTIEKIIYALKRIALFFEFRCWLLKVSRDAIFGFVILGLALFLLGKAHPRFYNFITQWANAPELTDFKSCSVAEILDNKVPGLASYRIEVKVSDKTDSVHDLIFFVNGPGISVYEVGQKDKLFDDERNLVSHRFVSSERSREQTFRFDVTIEHKEQGTVPFSLGPLNEEECPVEVHDIRRKK